MTAPPEMRNAAILADSGARNSFNTAISGYHDEDGGATPLSVFQADALARADVTKATALAAGLFRVRGFRDARGYLDLDPMGSEWIGIPDDDDIVFWAHATGKFAFWRRQHIALAEDRISSAATYAFGSSLNVFASPLEWLAGGCDGIVVIQWRLAFDRLRDVPRITVAESLVPTYRKWMAPQTMPKVFVRREQQRAA